MAGHSKYANIKHRKGAQDAKRAKVFTKLVREISVAARQGQPDIDFNPRLRNAVITARKAGVPRDRIETAIKKASGGSQGENYEDIHYEGYGPSGIALIIDALTDSRNRTAAEVRSCFTKNGGNLGEMGSVEFMFTRVGLIEYSNDVASNDEIFEIAADAGANDVESDAEFHYISCALEDLNNVRDALSQKYGDAQSVKIGWSANSPVDVSSKEQAESILKLVDALEELDDVQNVWGNYIITQDAIEA